MTLEEMTGIVVSLSRRKTQDVAKNKQILRIESNGVALM